MNARQRRKAKRREGRRAAWRAKFPALDLFSLPLDCLAAGATTIQIQPSVLFRGEQIITHPPLVADDDAYRDIKPEDVEIANEMEKPRVLEEYAGTFNDWQWRNLSQPGIFATFDMTIFGKSVV